MTLKIKPVKLRQSVYFRVPNDIVDLIGLQTNATVTLRLEEREDKYLLTYAVEKPFTPQTLPFRRKRTDDQLVSPAPVE